MHKIKKTHLIKKVKGALNEPDFPVKYREEDCKLANMV